MAQTDGQRAKEAKEAEEKRRKSRLHERNFAGMPDDGTGDRARLLEVTVDSELDAPDDALENLAAKDFPLANYDELADPWEFKAMQEIMALLAEVRHPHPESALQGVVREWAFDEPGKDLKAQDPEDIIKHETFLLGAYSRATRGEEGFQQETSAKQTRESITVDENGAESGGSLRSNIPGL